MAYERIELYLKDMEAALTRFESELIKNSPGTCFNYCIYFI